MKVRSAFGLPRLQSLAVSSHEDDRKRSRLVLFHDTLLHCAARRGKAPGGRGGAAAPRSAPAVPHRDDLAASAYEVTLALPPSDPVQ